MFTEYNDILCVADVCEILLIGRNSVSISSAVWLFRCLMKR